MATLGARGAVVVTADGATAIPALKAKVVDTTGAGDCFVGALAARMAAGATPVEAARYASRGGVLFRRAAGRRAVDADGAGSCGCGWRGPKSPAMVEELFRQDAYLKDADATVTAVEERGVRLDRTIFYPTGGGQPGDSGVLRWDGGEAKIVDAVKADGGDVLHVLAPDAAAAGGRRQGAGESSTGTAAIATCACTPRCMSCRR